MWKYREKSCGFSLIELMVSLLIMTAVIIGVLTLLDSTTRLAEGQINRVDLQQSLRIAQTEVVRMIRLAGRGGLPFGWAVSLDNNVKNKKVIDEASAPVVMDDTDLLVVRGVLSTPVYLVEHLDKASFSLNTANKTGRVIVRDVTRVGHQPQDLEVLREMLEEGGRPEALILTSAFDSRVFGVVEIDHNKSVDNTDSIELGFKYANTKYSDQYAKLSSDGGTDGAFPEEVMAEHRIGTVGILEEYRFYLRPAPGSRSRKLSRARTYPNIAEAYGGQTVNLQVDIAENVIDFQIAMAFDGDGDGEVLESDDGAADDWLGNSPSDDPQSAPWPAVLANASRTFRFLRLTTLARTPESHPGYRAREILRLEDHEIPITHVLNDIETERKHPRIVYRTLVEMRNL